jgi:2-succinyl-6-hydroxy-2,4-cyclohexadiene-1-carboxylate synthase
MKIQMSEVTYHVVEAGAGKGTPLLLLHGFTGSVENWSEHIQSLAREFRVIAVDLPGHGLTEAPDQVEYYRMDRVAADLIKILDKLAISQAHLIGYSMGGRLALYTAIHYPDRTGSLILESASPGLETEAERFLRRQEDEGLAQKIVQKGVVAFINDWEKLPLFASQTELSENARAQLRKQRLQNETTGLVNSLRGMGTGVQDSLWGRLPDVKCPVLLLSGEQDIKFTMIAWQMINLLPNAQLQIVMDAGHTIHLEQPELFDQYVMDFIWIHAKRAG